MAIKPEWFRSQRTFRAASRVEDALNTFARIGAVDRHIAVELALHDVAATVMDRVGLVNEARQLRYRIRNLETTEAASRAEMEQRRAKARFSREKRALAPTKPTRRRPTKSPTPSTAAETVQQAEDAAFADQQP